MPGLPSYDEHVTSNAPQDEQEPQWQQPSFDAGAPAETVRGEGLVVSGPLIVPAEPPMPPSAMETAVNTLAGVIWPVMIVLAIMNTIGWWPAILIAIVTTTVLGNVGGHLKSRRKALGRGRTIPPGDNR